MARRGEFSTEGYDEVPIVELTGDAITGLAVSEPHARAVAQLPVTVRLGRRPPRPQMKLMVPHVSDFYDPKKRKKALPAKTNWRDAAAVSIARMYLNDTYGDCVWASNIHLLGVTSANDKDSGGVVQATDSEVKSQYFGVCGPGDNGCVITDTLDYGMTKGWVANGKTYKIDGYAQVDWTNWDLLRACCADFGGFKIGVNLPSAWTSNSTWDVTSSRIVGGHDVYVIDVEDDFLWLSSWGRLYKLTKAAAISTRWLEEAYIVLVSTWYGADKLAPSGFNYDGLVAASAAIKGGSVPDDPGPVVPPPPPGPVPVTHWRGPVTVRIPILGTATGTADLVEVRAATLGGPLAVSDLWTILKDVGQLLADLGDKNWVELFNDVVRVLKDLGVDLPFFQPQQQEAMLASARSVNWLALVRDVARLVADYKAGNWLAVLADIKQLAADLGVGV